MTSYFSFKKREFENPWLDFLRTIAVGLVILVHGHAYRPHDTSPFGKFAHNLQSNGWVGVDLFFVLSGFLITSSLIRLRENSKKIDYRNFISQRALRILPAYYAVLFLILLGVFPQYKFQVENLGIEIFQHIFLLQDYFFSNINVVFWSLGVEEKFYLFAPLIVALFCEAEVRKKLFIFTCATICISPILRCILYLQFPDHSSASFQYLQNVRSPFHASLEPLIIGVAIAVFVSSKPNLLKPTQAKMLFGFLLFVATFWLASHEFAASRSLYDVILQPALLAIIFGALVYTATHLREERLIIEPVFRVSARLSYTLYLLHFPLLPLSGFLSQNSSESFDLFWVYFLTLSIIASLLIHYAVEKPFLLLKKRISNKPPVVTA